MSTITKELAKLFRKITNSEIDAEGNAHVVLFPADSLLINNARIALASLEASDVAAQLRGSPMTALNKQALREAAEKATSGKWERGDGNGNGGELLVYSDDALGSAVCEMTSEYNAIPKYQRINNLNFISAANPATVLALLDELDAAAKSNAFLKGQLAELANFNHDWDKLEASYESWRKIAAELLVVKLEALAGMGAEPVFKINHDSSLIKHVKKVVRETSAPQPLTTSERAELENYRNAQQVVRSITQHFDDIALETAREIMCDVNRRNEFLGGDVQLLSSIQCRIDDACRAAMLQAGNSPVTPDGWVMVPKEMTDAIGEAIAMQANCCGGIALDIYDAMLAAAPQQEVKSSLEHGMQRYAGAMQKLSEGDD